MNAPTWKLGVKTVVVLEYLVGAVLMSVLLLEQFRQLTPDRCGPDSCWGANLFTMAGFVLVALLLLLGMPAALVIAAIWRGRLHRNGIGPATGKGAVLAQATAAAVLGLVLTLGVATVLGAVVMSQF